MKELQLLDNKVLVVQNNGMVNLRELAKEMYPHGQDSNVLASFYNSKLFLLLEQQKLTNSKKKFRLNLLKNYLVTVNTPL